MSNPNMNRPPRRRRADRHKNITSQERQIPREETAPLPLRSGQAREQIPPSYDNYDSFPPGMRIGSQPDYYEPERPRRWPYVFMGLIGFIILAVSLLYFVVPQDGVLGEIRKPVASVIDKLIGKEEPRPNIVKFETAEPYGLTGGRNVFTITTDLPVENVRLRDESGNVIVGTSNSRDESRKIWTYTVIFDEEFEGVVYASVLDKDIWISDGKGIQLNITKPTEPPPLITQPPVVEGDIKGQLVSAQPIITEIPSPVETPSPQPAIASFANPTEDNITAPTPQIAIVQVAPQLPSTQTMPESQLATSDEPVIITTAPVVTAEPLETPVTDTGGSTFTAIEPSQEDDNMEIIAEPDDVITSGDGDDSSDYAADSEDTAEQQPQVAKIAPLPSVGFTAEAVSGTEPSNANYKDSVYIGAKAQKDYNRERPLNMPASENYSTYAGGVFTFRGDNFHKNAAHGDVDIIRKQLQVMWEADLGSLRTGSGTLHGAGWTGQPAIIKWSKELREAMNIYDDKKAVSPLREVILPAQDGYVYFFDLSDGKPTRDKINIGYPLKSSASVDPQGRPILAFGQGISKLASKTGDIGFYVYNLLNSEQLLFINGRKSTKQVQYATNGAFDGTALFDRTSDSMIIGGENGLLYTVQLNSEFDFANKDAMKLSISPEVLYQRGKGKQENPSVSLESSVAMYGQYIFAADKQGYIRCVDSTTMKTVWLFDAGDNTDAAIALDLQADGSLYLYTGTTVHNRSCKKGEAYIRCLNAATGEQIWSQAVKAKYDKSERAGVKASPVIGEKSISDLVFFTVNNVDGGGAKLLALNKLTGDIVWSVSLENEAISSPVAVYSKTGEAFIIQADYKGKLIMLNARDGQITCTLELNCNIDASPAVYDDILVIASCSKEPKIYGIRID